MSATNEYKYPDCKTGHCDKQICPDGDEFICICRDPADGTCDLAGYWRQVYVETKAELVRVTAERDAMVKEAESMLNAERYYCGKAEVAKRILAAGEAAKEERE